MRNGLGKLSNLKSGKVWEIIQRGGVKDLEAKLNNVNLSVLKLEKRYLHQNGEEFDQKLIGN